jgi:hypothetical protein
MDGQTGTIIEAIPTTQLRTELDIKKSTFYEAIAKLNITTFKNEADRKTSMVTAEDAQKITQYFEAKKDVELNGQPLETISLSELNRQTKPRTDRQAELLIPALEIISQLVPAAPSPDPLADPLATHRTLQEAADRNWQLSTHQLSELLGRSPKALQKYQTFQQFGFTFESFEKGKFRTWSVHKVER